MSETKEEVSFPPVNWMDFPNGGFPSEAIGTPILLIALDTEYQSNHTSNTNLCLSYQFAAYDLQTGEHKSGIFYMNVNIEERLTLGEFTHKVLKEMSIDISSLMGYRIIYVAHFFTAEWAMFKDRNDLYMKFEFIRKTLITTNRSLYTTILDEEGEEAYLMVDVRDTMLLLPEGYKSLEKASTFIEGYEKIDLPDEVKSNMYQFLQDEPILFEEYAIRDAEVTLKLFIKLQFLLNMINESEEKLFSTLASATTQDFISFSLEKFNEVKIGTISSLIPMDKTASLLIHRMQFDRADTLYKKYESLADRSYMGGLNSSYHIGHSKGFTFIDIDFKNAYPTAMNLLRIGDFGEKIQASKRIKKNISLEGL